jgi:hypothetical protein
MAKTCLLPILFLMLALGTAVSEPTFLDAIDADKLPNHRVLREETQWYRDHRMSIGRLGVDEAAFREEAELRTRLTRFLSLLDAQITKNERNADLRLLRVLVYWDFFAVTWSDYGGEIVSELLKAESLFPLDYRAFWFLGSFYAQTFRPVESIRQFSLVTETLNPDAPPPAFWRSYASAAGLADMPKHALEACRTCALLDPTYRLEEDIVFRVANHFRTPAFDEPIGPGSLYQFQVREEGFGILCRLFGVYIPVDKQWGTRSAEVKEAAASLVFTPEPVAGRPGAEVTFTITLEFSAHNRPDFGEYAADHLKEFKTAARSEEAFGDYPFQVYQVADPGRRKAQGGLHGYRLFLRRPEPAVKGLALERPVVSVFNPKTGEPYYRPQRSFDRYDGEIYYTLTLDCAEEGFLPAAAVFKEFVISLLFD